MSNKIYFGFVIGIIVSLAAYGFLQFCKNILVPYLG